MTREQMIDEAVQRAWQGLNERARPGTYRKLYPAIGDLIIEEGQCGSGKPYVNGAVGQVVRREFRRIVDEQVK